MKGLLTQQPVLGLKNKCIRVNNEKIRAAERNTREITAVRERGNVQTESLKKE